MIIPEVHTVDAVDQAVLGRFLREHYRPEKASFLERHGGWWHRGDHNRWVIEEGGEIAAYCAVIPSAMRVGGDKVDAAWWVDLVVGEKYRGRGLQSAFDSRVRASAPLVVGFPNVLAAKIHRRHGWGVRENLEVCMLPLRPLEIARRRAAAGGSRTGLRLVALAAVPWARWLRQRLASFEPRFSNVLGLSSLEALSEVFLSGSGSSATTTFRDGRHFAWRYLEAPYRDELVVVGGGRDNRLDVAAVVRVMQNGGGAVARLLDLFGRLDEPEIVRDVVWTAAKHAFDNGAIQMTTLSSRPSESSLLRTAGFIARSRARFCWTSADGDLQAKIVNNDLYLVLGDSDNDEP